MDQQIMNNNILRRMNRDSQTILFKNKPHVRIIHIFAPEIIKTDPANFRELVQRLTGKPSSTREKMIGKRSKKCFARNDDKRSDHGSLSADGSSFERVKSEEEAEIWRSSSSSGGSGDSESGGFLSGFGDMEDGSFMQQLGMFQPSNMDIQNPLLIHRHSHYYTHHSQRHHHQQQQQQQQEHRFLGEEDHTDHNRVI